MALTEKRERLGLMLAVSRMVEIWGGRGFVLGGDSGMEGNYYKGELREIGKLFLQIEADLGFSCRCKPRTAGIICGVP